MGVLDINFRTLLFYTLAVLNLLCLGVLPVFALEPAKQQASTKPSYGFFTILRSNFNAWDLNKDGALTGEEISQDLQNSDISGKNAAALSALKARERFDWRSDKAFECYTFNEIDQLECAFMNSDRSAQALVDYYKGALSKLKQQSPALFNYGVPHIGAIKQGRNSNCYFLSAVAAYSQARTAEFMKMYVENANQTYTVLFPGREPVTVSAPSPGEYATYPDAGIDGAWLTVMEKAYGAGVNKATIDGQEMVEDIDTIVLHGGSTATVIKNLTGHRVRGFHFNNPETSVQVPEILAGAFAAHRIVTAHVPGHALAVIEFLPERNLVLIWNPWGTTRLYKAVGEQMKNGFFWMPVQEFVAKFKAILVEQE
ncbi:MAG: hypothetical protein K2W95_05065 [Candidatus Obscuribacterales bacterium]|nr:hypothetical protein [Candidatus Obscuribacterales bacterium]